MANSPARTSVFHQPLKWPFGTCTSTEHGLVQRQNCGNPPFEESFPSDQSRSVPPTQRPMRWFAGMFLARCCSASQEFPLVVDHPTAPLIARTSCDGCEVQIVQIERDGSKVSALAQNPSWPPGDLIGFRRFSRFGRRPQVRGAGEKRFGWHRITTTIWLNGLQ